MKRIRLIVLLGIVMSVGFISTDLRKGLAEYERGECSQFIDGTWSFSAHPFMGEGYQSRPVVVSAVRTVAKTLTVSEVRVRNISSKPVTAIKLGWSISNDKSGPELVAQGESTLIPMEKTLGVGETTLLKLPLLSFTDLSQSLAANAKLNGNFDADVFVSQIMFEDKSQWKVGDKVQVEKELFNASIINVAFSKKSPKLSVMPLSTALVCPKQMCRYVEETPPGYTCVSSEHNEYCTNCITSCCNTICTDPSPSCGPCN